MENFLTARANKRNGARALWISTSPDLGLLPDLVTVLPCVYPEPACLAVMDAIRDLTDVGAKMIGLGEGEGWKGGLEINVQTLQKLDYQTLAKGNELEGFSVVCFSPSSRSGHSGPDSAAPTTAGLLNLCHPHLQEQK
jgi:hypothetical protein